VACAGLPNRQQPKHEKREALLAGTLAAEAIALFGE